jgi:DNA-binding NarL/FixJ family response regulator
MHNLDYFLSAFDHSSIKPFAFSFGASIKSIIKLLYVHEDLDENLVQRLSKQETEVVKWVLQGLSNDAISQHLGITVRTVKAHISSIFSKLHVNDRLNLVLLLKA